MIYTAPCKNCPDRTVEPNCHMTCKKYLSWMEEKNREKEQEMARKKADEFFLRRPRQV